MLSDLAVPAVQSNFKPATSIFPLSASILLPVPEVAVGPDELAKEEKYMRPIKTGIATMMVAGLASLAYASGPTKDVAQDTLGTVAGRAALAVAAQEPKAPEPRPAEPKAAPAAKAPRADKAQRADQKADKEQKQDKKQAKADQKADAKAGGKGGKIPDKDFKTHFGQEHKFKAQTVIRTTTIVPNQTRFVYSGYSFMFVDPWPAGWLLSDDLYIDYIDGGYYILDPFHPGVQVGLSVVM